MNDSRQLLADYASNGSEAAFRELLARHLNLVYSVALRLVEGDAHRAEDVAQTVFMDLARMARSLHQEAILSGWLHRHTCFVTAKMMRSERRRHARERRAVEMNAMQTNSDESWMLLAPILDEAINQLGDTDRAAILLRLFERRDFRSVGAALGSNEDAARMRVNRALEKLRTRLKRRGVTTSAAALGAVLTVGAVESAPAGLAAAISTAVAVAGTTATTSTVIAATKAIAMTTFQKAIIGAALTAAIGTGVFEAHRAAQLHEQNQTLQEQQTSLARQFRQLQRQRDDAAKRLALLSAKPAPRLPAPPVQIAANTNAALVEGLPFTNLWSRFTNGAPKLTTAQVQAYLKTNRTNAVSLLATYRASGDVALLQEAMRKYPNDPEVDFEAIFDKDLSPQERRQWLNKFEKSAPDNALANYLSAYNYFNSGQIDHGIQELIASAGKGLTDYTSERAEDDREAYLSAGYSAAEAAYISDSGLRLPELYQIKHLGVDLVDLANAYNQAGDQASAQAVLQTAVNLGQRYEQPSTDWTLISQLVGIAIQKIAFGAMPPNSRYGNHGQTVQDQLNQIAQKRAAITELAQQAVPLLPTLSNQDDLNYLNRRMLFGELAAMLWLVNKYGKP